jgi:UDP-N-acetyl-D-mannosaminuronic acid transferase (WecB/TagA/CpsF family)
MTINVLDTGSALNLIKARRGTGMIMSALNLFMLGFLRDDPGFTNEAVFWCDGLMAKRYIRAKGVDIDRIHGVELLRKLLPTYAGDSIHVLGSLDPQAEALLRAHRMNVVGHDQLSTFDIDKFRAQDIRLESDLVFILLPSPKQEMLARRLAADPRYGKCHFYCFGGALEMLANPGLYCPPTLQRLGLEFLFRLKTDTRRRTKRLVHSALSAAGNFGFLRSEEVRLIREGSCAEGCTF